MSCCFYIPFVMILIVSALLSWMILFELESDQAPSQRQNLGAGVSLLTSLTSAY